MSTKSDAIFNQCLEKAIPLILPKSPSSLWSHTFPTSPILLLSLANIVTIHLWCAHVEFLGSIFKKLSDTSFKIFVITYQIKI